MQEKGVNNPRMTEENVVAKVAELLETLDHVKKYNAFTRALKKFSAIVIGSIAIFLAVGASVDLFGLSATLERPEMLLTSILWLLIPIIGIITGVLFIRKRVKSIKTGEWKEELSHGFPSALRMLTELDWDKTFDEISSGRISYAFYGLLKLAAYWIIIYFALGFLCNFITFVILHMTGLFIGPIWALISLLIVYLLLRKDLSRRYNEIRALDKLLWELRWFNIELKRAEFKT